MTTPLVTALLAVALGLLIGVVLGALGGGGAILTVPALVYALGQSPHDATTGSLAVVGVTAVAGAVAHARCGHVRWRTGAAFGAVGVGAAFAGSVLNRHVDERALLLAFSALMVVAAWRMVLPVPDVADTRRGATSGAGRAVTVVKVVVGGAAVGLLTGFFGVGGGFVVVPVLVLALRLPMTLAVGTSLVVIAVNCAASLAARAGEVSFEWPVIAPLALAAMAGSGLGRAAASRVPGRTLARAFAVLLVVVAAYTATRTLWAPVG